MSDNGDSILCTEDSGNLTSVVNKLKLPELCFDSDESDTEDVEPVIFHPCIKKEKGVLSDEAKPNLHVQNIRNNTSEHTGDIENSLKSNTQVNELVNDKLLNGLLHLPNDTTLVKPEVAEIELDVALSHCSPRKDCNNTCAVGLSDSNTSSEGSSILNQLDITMEQLRIEKQNEKDILEDQLKLKSSISLNSENNSNKNSTTNHLDLRKCDTKQVPVNLCVLERYGRNMSYDDKIEQEYCIEDERERIKKESEMICSQGAVKMKKQECNNGNSNTILDKVSTRESKLLEDIKTIQKESEEQYGDRQSESVFQQSNDSKVIHDDMMHEEKSVEKSDCGAMIEDTSTHSDYLDNEMNSSEKISCVNEMLANVNRMIYKISEPEDINDCSTLIKKSGEVKTLYDNDIEMYDDTKDILDELEMNEYVQKYTVYNNEELNGTEQQRYNGDIEGIEQYVTPNLYVSRLNPKANGQNGYDPDSSNTILDDTIENNDLPTNLETRTKVIEWSSIIDDEQIDSSAKSISPVKSPVKRRNIFDSLFTTSFISANIQDNTIKTNKIDTSPKKDILGKKKKSVRNIKVEELNDKKIQSASFNKDDEVSGLCSPKYDGKGKIGCDKNDFITVMNTVQEFKKEIHECIKHEKNLIKDENLTLSKLSRQLNFGNNYINMTNNTEPMRKDCVACSVTNAPPETPVKHDDYCSNKLHASGDSCSKTQSVGVSTNDLINYINKENQLPLNETKTKKNKKKKKKNKKNLKTEQSVEFFCEKDLGKDLVSPIPLVDEYKEEKNLKNISNHLLQIETQPKEKIESVEEKEIIQQRNEKAKVDNGIIKMLHELIYSKEETILFDEAVSFDQCYKSLPETNKQLLVLKVPLESPAVCKGTNNDSKLAISELKSSDNFIGLISLFLMLLQGSKWEISAELKDIPFDVVSLQQCQLEEELMLIVGVAENNNTYQYKTKRTKLGSSFFHAVSNFLNNNLLEDILGKIWQHVQQKFNQNQFLNANVWQQQLQYTDKSNIPGSGKLSTFVNVLPDLNVLRRILDMPVSLTPKEYSRSNFKNANKSKLNWFDSLHVTQEYTCINIENILLMSPKHVIEFFKRLRNEAIEICGLRIGYASNNKHCNPILSIAIHEVDAAKVEEGKILLSDCEQLKKVAISFQNIENEVSVTNEPIIKYSLNKNRSFRKVVQWFGPNFKNMADAQSYVNEYKLNKKLTNNVNGKNTKRKPGSELNSNSVPLLISSPSYGILFVSVALRSTFLAFIISLAGKKGLQLKSLVRNSFITNQLHSFGMSDLQIDSIRNCQRLSPNNQYCGFNILLFYGNSVVLKLHGLIEKLTFVMNNQMTGETINNWTSDKIFYIKEKSHNISNNQMKRVSSSQDYFVVLNLLETTQSLFTTSSTCVTNSLNVYKLLSDVSLNQKIPNLNLLCFILSGDEIIKIVPDLLKKVNSDYFLSCLTSLQKVFGNINSAFDSPLELLGIKYIFEINKQQIRSLTPHGDEVNENNILNTMLDKNTAILIFKGNNLKIIESVQTLVNDYLKHLQLDSQCLLTHTDEAYIYHLMFQHFNINEIFADNVISRNQMPSIYLQENHSLFTIIEKMYNLNILKTCIKKDVSANLSKSFDRFSLKSTTPIYEVNISDLSYPLQLLLSNNQSYAGYSVKYRPENAGVIIKVLLRFIRMGFVICGLRFPVYQKRSSSYQLHVGLMRQDALIVLNKMMIELENTYESLKSTVTETVNEVKMFFTNELKSERNDGGMFYCNYWAIIEKLQFDKDDAFDGQQNRLIEWNPQSSSVTYEYDYMKEESVLVASSVLTSTTIKTHEVSVLILTEPLLSGKYLGKTLPLESTFLQFWSIMEKIGYRAIGLKMTSLTDENTRELLNLLDVEDSKKKRMVNLLSNVDTPFVAIAMLGSCIVSNIWIQLERNLKSDDAIECIKKHTLSPTTRHQAERLLTSLFTNVYPNAKLNIQTMMD